MKKDHSHLIEAGKSTRFKKGCPSPNPAGRTPKIKTLTSWLRDELPRPAHEVPAIRRLCVRMSIPDDYPIGRVLALALIIQALKGCPASIKEVWMRADGAPSVAADVDVTVDLPDDLTERIKRALAREPLKSGEDEELPT